MNDAVSKEDIQHILSVLGSDMVLDTLLCVRELERATASEVAAKMGTHVATAVKHLSGLYDIGILDRQNRRGKTRSAWEYSIRSASFGIDIDLDELAHGTSSSSGDSGIYLLLMKDLAGRFAKFSGKSVDDVVSGWGVRDILDSTTMVRDEILRTISHVLEMETEEYGELTVRSVAAASAEAVGIIDLENLPKKFFGVSK